MCGMHPGACALASSTRAAAPCDVSLPAIPSLLLCRGMAQLMYHAHVIYVLDAIRAVVAAPPGRQEANPNVERGIAGALAAAIAAAAAKHKGGGSGGAWWLPLELVVCPSDQVEMGDANGDDGDE